MEKAMFFSELLGFLVVILPVLIFFIVFAPIFKHVRKMNGFDKLLSDVDTITEQSEDEKKPPKTTPKRSASRLILLLSGMASIVLAICITSYYFYMNVYCITCKSVMDLADFTNVLLALGIGVVPYAVNRLKPRKPDN